MLVGTHVVRLDQIMINVLRRQADADPIEAHGLELQHGERAEHVLQQHLIDGQRDLLPGRELALDQMRAHQFLRKVERHLKFPALLA